MQNTTVGKNTVRHWLNVNTLLLENIYILLACDYIHLLNNIPHNSVAIDNTCGICFDIDKPLKK